MEIRCIMPIACNAQKISAYEHMLSVAEAHPDEKQLSADCGNLPERKSPFHKLRKPAHAKNVFPYNKVFHFLENQQSLK